MHYIRRAALRAVSAQPSTLASRTYVTRTPFALRAQRQTSVFQKRFASNDTASPTDATTTGETVPPETSEADRSNESPAENESPYETVKEEPSVEEQRNTIREKSIRGNEDRNERSTAESMVDGVRQGASRAVNATRDAARGTFGMSDRHSSGMERSPKDASPSKILYVGNLFFDVRASALEKEFKQFGNIVNCKIASDADGRSKGFGYVEFDNLDSAAAAIQSLDQQVFEGRRMIVQYHVRRQPSNSISSQPRNPPSKTLFIGNLSFQMTDKDLGDLFRECKNVLDIRIAIDRRSGQPRGFAHADFMAVEDAQIAKDMLEKKQVYGRYLRLDFAKVHSSMNERNRDDRANF